MPRSLFQLIMKIHIAHPAWHLQEVFLLMSEFQPQRGPHFAGEETELRDRQRCAQGCTALQATESERKPGRLSPAERVPLCPSGASWLLTSLLGSVSDGRTEASVTMGRVRIPETSLGGRTLAEAGVAELGSFHDVERNVFSPSQSHRSPAVRINLGEGESMRDELL